MVLERVLPQRRQLRGELLAHRHRERRRDADVMQRPLVVVQPEQQRADRILSALVPAKTGDDAVGRARVLDLDHRALAGLVGAVVRLRDHAVEAGAFEALQPLGGDLAIARHRREVERRLDVRQQLLRAASRRSLAARRAGRGRRPRAGRTRRTTTASPSPAWRRARRPDAAAAAARRSRAPAASRSRSRRRPRSRPAACASSSSCSSGK